MDFAAATPDMIADAMMLALPGSGKPNPVEADGARKAAAMIGGTPLMLVAFIFTTERW